jgi:hypothetical protein
VQRYPIVGKPSSSRIAQEAGAATVPGGGATRVAACKGAERPAAAYLAQPITAPSQSTAPAVMLGGPALVAGVPASAKVGVAVVTLLCRKECSSATARHHQERQAPAQEALAPPGPVPTAAKKRASRHAPEKPLAAEPGPAAAVGRKAGAGNLAGVTAEPTP